MSSERLKWTHVALPDLFLDPCLKANSRFRFAAHVAPCLQLQLANEGVDTRTIRACLGHKPIQRTARYTELSLTRFKSLFRD